MVALSLVALFPVRTSNNASWRTIVSGLAAGLSTLFCSLSRHDELTDWCPLGLSLAKQWLYFQVASLMVGWDEPHMETACEKALYCIPPDPTTTQDEALAWGVFVASSIGVPVQPDSVICRPGHHAIFNFSPADPIHCSRQHYHNNTHILASHVSMEVVGFVAAVGSIAKAGHAAGKLASTIRKVAKEAGDVGKRIEKASWIFTSFEHSIRTAQVSINYRFPDNNDSPVIQYIERFGVLESLQSLSDGIRREIMDQRKEILTIPSRFDIVTSWKWTRMKPEIMELHPQMESMKTTFTLVIGVITLEHAVAKNKVKPSEEYEREIEFLKTTIEDYIQIIRHLRQEQQPISVSIHTSNASNESLGSRLDDKLRVVCHLGQSFVETEAVPTRPPDDFSFKDAKRRQSYRRRHAASTSREASVRLSAISSPTLQPRARPTSTSGNGSLLVPVPVPVPGPSSPSISRGEGSNDTLIKEVSTVAHVESVPDDNKERRVKSRHIPDSEPLEISKSSNKSEMPSEEVPGGRQMAAVDKIDDKPETKNLQADEPLTPTEHEQQEIDKYSRKKQKQTEISSGVLQQPEPTPPQTPTSPTQISPLSTTSSHSYRHPGQSHRRVPSGGGEISRTPVAGYIVNKTGRHLFKAHVDRQLLGSLITPEYAQELGLPIKHHPPEIIKYRDAEIESVGRVSLDWSTRSSNTLVEPGSVECTVCEPLEYPLIFGQWFVKAQKHMTREEERRI